MDINNMKIKMMVILSVAGIAILSGCITESKDVTASEGKVKIEERVGSDWCKIGTKMTAPSPQGKQESFIVKGMTIYNGNRVCEAGWITQDESISRYFNEDGSYIVVTIKDKSGKIMQEINIRF